MSGSVFVDTNVFVYLFESDARKKQDTARILLERLAKEATIAVSTQVLQEFYVSVTRKLAQPLSPQNAMEAARGLSAYRVVQVDPHGVQRDRASRKGEDFFLGRVDRTCGVGIWL